MSQNKRNRTAAERVAKWDRRLTGERVKEIIDQEKDLMLERNVASTTDMVRYELLTKQVLNREGVSVIDVPDFLAYSRELWAKRRKFAGKLLVNEVQVVLQKWASRDLSAAVLARIRDDVYTIPAPAGP